MTPQSNDGFSRGDQLEIFLEDSRDFVARSGLGVYDVSLWIFRIFLIFIQICFSGVLMPLQ
ncbi:MAG: hypothetical protein AB7T38_01530 [Nitrospirales bacterium]